MDKILNLEVTMQELDVILSSLQMFIDEEESEQRHFVGNLIDKLTKDYNKWSKDMKNRNWDEINKNIETMGSFKCKCNIVYKNNNIENDCTLIITKDNGINYNFNVWDMEGNPISTEFIKNIEYK